MGGGDLNMKKSWHPLLMKNQERVWLEEKKALEEKKKLDQLRKEKEEERQLQELQRLQEEKTGKKRVDKLEWMYATPASGSGQNDNDREDYLLGKKRIDKVMTADENAKVGAAHKNFIAVQNANTVRDIQAKIREDPLFAIKQQEQAAYEALMSNPLRLREMQMRNGIKPPKKDKAERKKEKEDKKRRKEEKRRLKSGLRGSHSPSPLDSREHSPADHRRSGRRSRSRSADYHRSRRSASPDYSRSRQQDRRADNDRGRSRSRSPVSTYRNGRGNDSYSRRRHSPSPSRSRSRTPEKSKRPRSASRGWDREMSYPKRQRLTPPREAPSSAASRHLSTVAGNSSGADDRAAKLAAMSSNATSMSSERQERLLGLLEQEKADLAAEEEARKKSKGMGDFLSTENKKAFGGSGGLEDRIRRGKAGMRVEAD